MNFYIKVPFDLCLYFWRKSFSIFVSCEKKPRELERSEGWSWIEQVISKFEGRRVFNLCFVLVALN